MTYPQTRADSDVVDVLHGVSICDPYRWLEDGSSSEVRDWITRQNEFTDAALADRPGRDEFRTRLAALKNHDSQGAPRRQGGTWLQLRQEGLANQPVLWVATPEPGQVPSAGDYRPLLDVNALSKEGTLALSEYALSPDGRHLAWAVSDSGSDWNVWRVRDVASGEDSDDVVRWSKFENVAWLPDSSGFLYVAYDEPKEGQEFTAESTRQKLKLHRLGDSTANDTVVFEQEDQPTWGFGPEFTHDGRRLIIRIWEGTHPENRIFLSSFVDGRIETPRPFLQQADAAYEFLGGIEDELYFRTNKDAPNGRIVAISVPAEGTADGSAWRDVVSESDDRIEKAVLAGPEGAERIVVHSWHHATSRLTVHLPTGGDDVSVVELPILGSILDFRGSRRDQLVFFELTGFSNPVELHSHDLQTGETTRVFRPQEDPARPEIITEQVFVQSGQARVPVFLVRRKDVEPNGAVPTILHGYGGFDISITPSYSAERLAWVEKGGLYAVACLRGGGEYGQSWHDAGRLANKQNVFDDAIAVATWLTSESGWTTPKQLGMQGRSNGGLLVGAVMTQRPDLFGSCAPEVGVMDMLRFHLFTIGWGWVSDYGCADDPEQFRWLLSYSPLHNLMTGTHYPPTMVTTGDHDDRVVPGHSFKFAAALQAAQGGDGPALIRIDVAAGHGAGKPTSKWIEERADVLAFHAHHLGLDVAANNEHPNR